MRGFALVGILGGFGGLVFAAHGNGTVQQAILSSTLAIVGTIQFYARDR